MSKKTSYLLGILLTIIIGTILYWWLCCRDCTSCENKNWKDKNIVKESPKVKKATVNPFSIKDGSFALNSKNNFNFKGSEYHFIEPISDDLKNAEAKLKAYLNENPSKRINVIGYYTATEKNNSAYPNLGLARANSVKNYMVSQGIPSKLIDTYGELKNGLAPDANNVYFGPVDYKVKTIAADDTSEADEIKALHDKILANPLVLNFKSGQTSIVLTAEQRQKIADISKYLDKVNNAKCLVVGHTDNTGNAATNMQYGQERADFAKKYLIENEIPDAKITTISKGQTEPIADNATEEGKAKNRRTVITINE
ncbi:OmpA family protein [Kordia sp.]|uniref:OmpA family protein n=1 Tax=Kordia sp. TaxID=1965332 RepID=UPI003B5CC3D6